MEYAPTNERAAQDQALKSHMIAVNTSRIEALNHIRKVQIARNSNLPVPDPILARAIKCEVDCEVISTGELDAQRLYPCTSHVSAAFTELTHAAGILVSMRGRPAAPGAGHQLRYILSQCEDYIDIIRDQIHAAEEDGEDDRQNPFVKGTK